MNMNKIYRFILDIFYPNRCPCCNVFIPYDEYICQKCLSSLENPMDKLCKYCGFYINQCKCGKIPYQRAFTCYTYDGLARDGVLSLKHGNNLNFAYHTGNILSERIKNEIVKYDVVVPVPMHIRKKLKRGYNQAEVIAKVISKNLNIPLDAHALKVEYSKHTQHSLNKSQRIENAKKLYHRGDTDLTDKYVILVDDITTTASTLSVCSDILRGMGAKYIIVATACSDQLKKSPPQ